MAYVVICEGNSILLLNIIWGLTNYSPVAYFFLSKNQDGAIRKTGRRVSSALSNTFYYKMWYIYPCRLYFESININYHIGWLKVFSNQSNIVINYIKTCNTQMQGMLAIFLEAILIFEKAKQLGNIQSSYVSSWGYIINYES